MKFKAKRVGLPPRITMFIMTGVCLLLLLLSLLFKDKVMPLKVVSGSVVVPMQKVINSVGTYVKDKHDMIEELRNLQTENVELKEQLANYKTEAKEHQQDMYELDRLRQLFELSETYPDYDMIGARVISKEAGNWFSTFVIDKGTDDGIDVDCNVMSGYGLVGIVIETGTNWARVRSIVDDTSNVSAMFINNEEFCTVAGNLATLNEGYIDVKYIDKDADVSIGDEIVTSYISDKYFPKITIGYVESITPDANNLTKSARLTPVVDFSNIQEVLVIKKVKQTVD